MTVKALGIRSVEYKAPKPINKNIDVQTNISYLLDTVVTVPVDERHQASETKQGQVIKLITTYLQRISQTDQLLQQQQQSLFVYR